MIKHNLEKSFFWLTVQEGYTSMLVEWRRGGWNRKWRDLACSNCKHRTERANRKRHEFLHSQSLPGLSFGRTEMELIGSIWRLEVSSPIVVGKSLNFLCYCIECTLYRCCGLSFGNGWGGDAQPSVYLRRPFERIKLSLFPISSTASGVQQLLSLRCLQRNFSCRKSKGRCVNWGRCVIEEGVLVEGEITMCLSLKEVFWP